jgi:hypothetical protein
VAATRNCAVEGNRSTAIHLETGRKSRGKPHAEVEEVVLPWRMKGSGSIYSGGGGR